MARLDAYYAFDLLNFDFSTLYYDSVSADFYDNIFVPFRGRLIEDSISVDYPAGGYLVNVAIGGSGFLSDGTGFVAGTVTVVGEAVDTGLELDQLWELDGIRVSLRDFYAATLTSSRDDDYVVVQRMLSGNDVFFLSDDTDRAFGAGGNDTLYGYGGNDTLGGGIGHDRLYGGVGADQLLADAGNDLLDGGSDIDWLIFEGSLGGRVDLARTGQQATGYGRDVIRGIENVMGGAGADRLSGGSGNDRLIGGAGGDVLTGGAGADRFVFRTLDDSRSGGSDVITDFRRGVDRIDLSLIDADRLRPGNQVFQMTDRFEPGDDAQLVVQRMGGANQTRVLLDVNGDGRADAVIRLAGVLSLTETDFIL